MTPTALFLDGYFFWMDVLELFITGAGIGFGAGLAFLTAALLSGFLKPKRRKFQRPPPFYGYPE